MDQIRFEDGAGYERFMGAWSQRVGDVFLDWLAPPTGWRWLDVGCGNGAFTERVLLRCAPSSVTGVDPSLAQLAYARARAGTSSADFHLGDAMALPFPDARFDVAVMPLVLFFVPEPAVGVAEMVRVVVPGGVVCAYSWDLEERGHPYATLHDEMRALGLSVPQPPHPEASRLDELQRLWLTAGLESIETQVITVRRTFVDFDDYWTTVQMGPSVGRPMQSLSKADASELARRMRALLPVDENGRITYDARAHAIRGVVPRAVGYLATAAQSVAASSPVAFSPELP